MIIILSLTIKEGKKLEKWILEEKESIPNFDDTWRAEVLKKLQKKLYKGTILETVREGD